MQCLVDGRQNIVTDLMLHGKPMQFFRHGIPPQRETLSECANMLHDEITGVVWYCAKNSGFFTVQFFSPK